MFSWLRDKRHLDYLLRMCISYSKDNSDGLVEKQSWREFWKLKGLERYTFTS